MTSSGFFRKTSFLPWCFVALAILLGLGFRAFQLLDPAPFGDAYHHWWVAAHLVETKGVSTLFTQPDGAWPPLYALFSAGLLSLFGTHSMLPLQWANILFAAFSTLLVALLARANPEEDQKSLRFAPPLAAALFAFSPIDILTSSAPAMDPLAVVLLLVHFLISRKENRPNTLYILAGVCLAAACLTRYEAWGYLALALFFQVFQRKPRNWKRSFLLYGPAILCCLFWAGLAGFSALGAKLFSEAARHTGEDSAFGPLFGRSLVAIQTLLLASSPLLPAALVTLRRKNPFSLAVRLFALLLISALVFGIISALIAGSHRYIELALPVYAVLASRFWLEAKKPAVYIAAAIPLLGFLLSTLAYYGGKYFDWNLGFFWFYTRPFPLICLLLSAIFACFLSSCSTALRALGASSIALALAISYLPILSNGEIGKFVKPFQYAGEILQKEKTGIVLIDNPIPGYFSKIPPERLVMINRPKEFSSFLSPKIIEKIINQDVSERILRKTLVEKGVTHIVSEEVPYLFSQKSLLPNLPKGSLIPLYWTRAIVFREIVVFRLVSENQ